MPDTAREVIGLCKQREELLRALRLAYHSIASRPSDEWTPEELDALDVAGMAIYAVTGEEP